MQEYSLFSLTDAVTAIEKTPPQLLRPDHQHTGTHLSSETRFLPSSCALWM